MSIAALADEEILRTEKANLDVAPIVGKHFNQLVANLHLQNDQIAGLAGALRPVASEPPLPKTAQSSALDGLVKYIPTESVTLYVAATAALPTLTAAFPPLTPSCLYWIFVVLTPILFLLIYVGKRRSQQLRPLPSLRQWPWWKLCASTIAFMVWALAIPPFIDSDAGKVAAAFGALLVSTLLSLLGGAIEPQPMQPAE